MSERMGIHSNERMFRSGPRGRSGHRESMEIAGTAIPLGPPVVAVLDDGKPPSKRPGQVDPLKASPLQHGRPTVADRFSALLLILADLRLAVAR